AFCAQLKVLRLFSLIACLTLLTKHILNGCLDFGVHYNWTTETLINQINKGNILLNPEIQRRDAWDKKRKSLFVESLILGLPVPQVVLAESKERRGAYIVLDGKQRMLSIRQFASSPNDPHYEQLKLTGLEIRKDLRGKTLQSLQEDLT